MKLDGPASATVFFDFDNDFLSLHVTAAISSAAAFARQRTGARLEVTGYRAATRLSDGKTMTEKAGMGEIRARKVAGILEGLGIPAASIVVNAPVDAVKADGINDPWNRRVVIVVKP